MNGFFGGKKIVAISDEDVDFLSNLPKGKSIGNGQEISYYKTAFNGKKAILAEGTGPTTPFIDVTDTRSLKK